MAFGGRSSPLLQHLRSLCFATVVTNTTTNHSMPIMPSYHFVPYAQCKPWLCIPHSPGSRPSFLISRIPDLPAELIHCIFRENRGDVDTLRSCALVCRSWAPIAQSYLYETLHLIIKVSPPSRFSTLPRIARVAPDVGSLRRIRSSQHLTAFIKTVSLHICPSKTPWPGLSGSSRVQFHLSELFLTLSNVRHLIYINTIPQTPFLKIVSAPTIILTSPKLVSISVPNAPFDDLSILLLHATNSPKLCIGSITADRPRDELRTLHRLTFKSLAVYGNHIPLANAGSPLHSVLEFEKLTQLHIAFRKTTLFFEDSGAITTAETLIRRFQNTLQTLTLNMYLYTPLLTLIIAKKIRHLKFELYSMKWELWLRNWLDWLIESFSLPNLPEGIELEECTFTLTGFSCNSDLYRYASHWCQLDSVLASRCHIRRLVVQLQPVYPGLPSPSVKLVEALFPFVRSSATLVVEKLGLPTVLDLTELSLSDV
ncbi:hypothetical protein EDD85DRAFT_583292 [Armillaria nabsnona]|nr:hypothetical protein EDD85DRAFT_583292 [Armillaria nabsnona]